MGTLAPGGRIVKEIVDEEIHRLREAWRYETISESDEIVEQVMGTEKASV
jgi:sigma54-dependent transcription regulator